MSDSEPPPPEHSSEQSSGSTETPSWQGGPGEVPANPLMRPVPALLPTVPPMPVRAAARRHRRNTAWGIAAIAGLVAIIAGLVWFGAQQGGDDGPTTAKGPRSANTSGVGGNGATPEIVTTTAAGSTTTSAAPAFNESNSVVPPLPGAGKGSAKKFCPLGATYRQGLKLLALAGSAGSTAESERIAEQAFPIWDQLVRAAPEAVYEPVAQYFVYAATMSTWTEVDKVFVDNSPPSAGGVEQFQAERRDYMSGVASGAVDGAAQAQAISRFLATCG